MREHIDEVSEPIEAMLNSKTFEDKVKWLVQRIHEFLMYTNKILQENLESLPPPNVKIYAGRINAYSELSTTLALIKKHEEKIEDIEKAQLLAQQLFEDIYSQFQTHCLGNEQKGREIMEMIIVPHYIFVKFFNSCSNNLQL